MMPTSCVTLGLLAIGLFCQVSPAYSLPTYEGKSRVYLVVSSHLELLVVRLGPMKASSMQIIAKKNEQKNYKQVQDSF